MLLSPEVPADGIPHRPRSGNQSADCLELQDAVTIYSLISFEMELDNLVASAAKLAEVQLLDPFGLPNFVRDARRSTA